MASKKAEAALVILVVLIIVAILYGVITTAVKECHSDTDCGAEKYCGSDFKCHEMKIITKEITVNEYNLEKAAFVLGAAIIIAAVILKWRRKS